MNKDETLYGCNVCKGSHAKGEKCPSEVQVSDTVHEDFLEVFSKLMSAKYERHTTT